MSIQRREKERIEMYKMRCFFPNISRPPAKALAMRLLIALAALASAVLALEDGKLYRQVVYDNGTVVISDAKTNEVAEIQYDGPLVEAYREAFARQDEAKKLKGREADGAVSAGPPRRVKPRRLDKREIGCWGTSLNHEYTDGAVQGWKNSVPDGYCTGPWPSHRSESLWVDVGNVKVYYCIEAADYCGNLDLVDVNYALKQMDDHCVRYTSSYFKWPGSPEIFGKCLVGTAVCQGG